MLDPLVEFDGQLELPAEVSAPERTKLAQVILVLLAKWTTIERLPKNEPRPWTVDAKSSV